MIAKKTLFLMVMQLAGGENGEKAKNCRVLRRVLARYTGILGIFWAFNSWQYYKYHVC